MVAAPVSSAESGRALPLKPELKIREMRKKSAAKRTPATSNCAVELVSWGIMLEMNAVFDSAFSANATTGKVKDTVTATRVPARSVNMTSNTATRAITTQSSGKLVKKPDGNAGGIRRIIAFSSQLSAFRNRNCALP